MQNEAPVKKYRDFEDNDHGFENDLGLSDNLNANGVFEDEDDEQDGIFVKAKPSNGTHPILEKMRIKALELYAQIDQHPALANFLAGTMAGTCNALIVNPISAIKYKSWSREINRGMVTEAIDMFPTIEHQRLGAYRSVRIPFRMRDADVRPRGPAPDPSPPALRPGRLLCPLIPAGVRSSSGA